MYTEIDELCSGSRTIDAIVIRKAMEKRRASIRQRFHRRDEDTIDILEQLLIFNPGKRLSAEQALAHPFISRWVRT